MSMKGAVDMTAVPGGAGLLSSNGVMGTYIDTQDYDGIFQAIVAAAKSGSSTDVTLAVKVTECDTYNGSYTDCACCDAAKTFTYAQLLAGVTVKQLNIDGRQCKRYLYIYGTLAGTTSPAATYGLAVLMEPKSA